MTANQTIKNNSIRNEQKLHHLEEAISEAPPAIATVAVRNAYTCRVAEQQEVACLMLEKGQSVSTYVLKMKAYLDQMEHFGYLMPLVLRDKGFRHEFMDNGAILVSKDNMFYFNAFPSDGSFEIDMHNHISNECSIYTCNNKKTKHNLDSTFLWHCCLVHINKKRIEKLQHIRFLKSIDDESFDVCVSCISGKMTRKPFTHASERADDILGIIHSKVCGPFRTTSREGANYYVTFTDDFSRHGYVYLIKHKHKVSEMFKTLQNEVENQLGKTIIALRSDQGGEYLSQEFLDHLKSCGIISQLTPPYTPQHNGVSKRRNQTLLDMVPSMMSLTTLPMSFGGYALESIARILNMVLTKKTDMDGNIHTYKAHLVVKGFTQTYGVDYEETFSPVADIKAIRILIAIEAYYDYEIWQMDVKTAFLNCRLNEDVYMNKRFDEEIKKYGFSQNPDESCVYKRASGSIITFLILYVDDILLMGNNIPMLQDVKSWLRKCFPMKDLDEAAYIPGIKIYRDRSRRLICLSKNAYIDKILKRFKIDTSKRGTIPMQPNVDLSKSQGPSTPVEVKRMKGLPYALAVGSIMYVVRCTRPNVVFSHNLTSRYQQNPSKSHWTAVKNIPKYLRNTKDMFLVYGTDSTTELGVTCFTDASWEMIRTTFDLKRAEYIAATEAAMEAIWIRKFIYGLGVVPNIDKPMDMYCDSTDNNLADPLTKPMPCTKHVEHARSIGLRPAGSFILEMQVGFVCGMSILDMVQRSLSTFTVPRMLPPQAPPPLLLRKRLKWIQLFYYGSLPRSWTRSKKGLLDKYDQVCGIMHHRDTFPDLKTTRSMLTSEEMRLKSKSLSLPVDSLSSSPLVLMVESGINRRPSNPQVKSWRPCYNFAKGSCRFGND
uniref:Integrase catalytic domain-containing protein n=1 Tax=Tanacetum cinerariifolium TaxID=118510 RepID=A0A6L2LJ63_TANCI|nr:hypothetical protein [Tanacetum cinerariifolium]